jgi:mannosyltransferase PIG-V
VRGVRSASPLTLPPPRARLGSLVRGLWPDVRVALLPWAVARALVGVAYVVAVVIADELTPGNRPYHLQQGLFAWDGTFYRDITEHGYGGVEEEGLRFFPLAPLLARAVAVPLFGARELALLVVANGAALVAGVLLVRLARRETGDDRLAERSAWLLALLPPALVLVLGYAESVLLALAVGAFLALRSGRWWTAAALGLLAGLCRPVGVALVLPAAVEAARGLRGLPWRGWVARGAAVVAPAAGLASYLAWVGAEFGDWRLPVRLQETEELRGGYANPLARAWDSFAGLFGEERFGDGLHAPWIVLYVALVVVLLWRWPLSYGLYAGAMLVVALAAEDIGSFERYGLAAFPLLLATAMVVRRGRMEAVVLAGTAGGLVGFSALVWLGTFVP